ncbi:hypothetical protein [Mesorhizobium sp. 113-3-3]|uniref:hypothetical protein n=1 Tax=Mesorhizobium sp. 113-3-3 TaxID=2744516 RepID=UPI0018EAD617|nr:hypothetical protein [Mesorhizobium sp. 113-3-3]BCG83479.1 hypothetical protein MesoLj113b_70210 [Mesorhizobium sp. 113-3-3]
MKAYDLRNRRRGGEAACDADAISNPVERINVTRYPGQPLENLDSGTNQREEDDQRYLSLGPAEASKEHQDGE